MKYLVLKQVSKPETRIKIRVKPEEKKIKNIRKEREAARQRKAYKF